MQLPRRSFLQSSLAASLSGLTPVSLLLAKGESIGGERPLLKPVHDQIVCPWSPQHPRHDHQLILPLDETRLMLVWSEYYSQSDKPAQKKGHSGIGDHVACQITSMISSDRGRTWGNRRVLQPNEWKQNVKHPNLVRLSKKELLFFYVGWDDHAQRNVYLRRSTDNGLTWGEQRQVSEPGWYCCNADRALKLSTGRVILPAHGPYAKQYIGGTAYKGGALHSFVFYSDDGFRTWKRSANSMTAKGRGCHEPTIVELKDGRLLCLLRNTNERIYQSISQDGGAHWSTPAPTRLPAPESPAIVKRIPQTGDLLLLWNNVASPTNWPRTPLTAAISKDEGATWTHFKDIEHRTSVDAAYPSLAFVGDEALIAYYSRSTKWKRDSEVTLRIYQIDQFYA